jgi:ABC-type phosphate transport system permease subunit
MRVKNISVFIAACILGFMIGPIIGKLVLNVFDYITLCSSLPLSSWQ